MLLVLLLMLLAALVPSRTEAEVVVAVGGAEGLTDALRCCRWCDGRIGIVIINRLSGARAVVKGVGVVGVGMRVVVMAGVGAAV